MFPHLKPQVAGGGGGIDEIKSMLEMIAAEQHSNNGYVLKSTGDSTKLLLAPPIVEIKQASAASADDIADNFLSYVPIRIENPAGGQRGFKSA